MTDITTWRLTAARWVLGELAPERLTQLAVDAMLRGISSEGVVRLAALDRSEAADVARVFEAALAEVGEALPEEEEAVWMVAQDVAASIAARQCDPLEGARSLIRLGQRLDPTPEALWVFVGIEAEWEDFGEANRTAFYGADYCAAVRENCEREIARRAEALARMQPVRAPVVGRPGHDDAARP